MWCVQKVLACKCIVMHLEFLMSCRDSASVQSQWLQMKYTVWFETYIFYNILHIYCIPMVSISCILQAVFLLTWFLVPWSRMSPICVLYFILPHPTWDIFILPFVSYLILPHHLIVPHQMRGRSSCLILPRHKWSYIFILHQILWYLVRHHPSSYLKITPELASSHLTTSLHTWPFLIILRHFSWQLHISSSLNKSLFRSSATSSQLIMPHSLSYVILPHHPL